MTAITLNTKQHNFFPEVEIRNKENNISKIAQKTLTREEAMEYQKALNPESKTFQAINRHMMLYDSGIHEVIPGLKVNLTKERLKGGMQRSDEYEESVPRNYKCNVGDNYGTQNFVGWTYEQVKEHLAEMIAELKYANKEKEDKLKKEIEEARSVISKMEERFQLDLQREKKRANVIQSLESTASNFGCGSVAQKTARDCIQIVKQDPEIVREWHDWYNDIGWMAEQYDYRLYTEDGNMKYRFNNVESIQRSSILSKVGLRFEWGDGGVKWV